MDLETKVLHFIRKQNLIKPGSAIIVGVSAGADSIVLAHILHSLRHDLSINLHIAHFNHRLRPEAGHDQRFVEEFARSLNLPCNSGVRESPSLNKKVSEDQARQWRFDFFVNLARKTKAQAVALAHTESDLAETVLMRLIRGSGLYGLRSILASRQINQVEFIRPLIKCQRHDIMAYIAKHHLKFRIDKTNVDLDYVRNKVRRQLLPYLTRKFNPNIHGVLVDLASTATDDYDLLQSRARDYIQKKARVSASAVIFPLGSFLKQHPSLQRLSARLAYEAITGNTQQLTFTNLQEMQTMLLSSSAKSKIHWPQSIVVQKLNNKIVIKRHLI